MKNPISNFVSYPVLVVLVGMLMLNVPFLGTLALLPTLGLLEFYDLLIPGEFGETGSHVEIGFAWITFKTPQAWLFFSSFFFFLGLLLALLVEWFNGPKFSFSKRKSLACSILVVFGLSTASYLLIAYVTYSAAITEDKKNFITPTEARFVCDESTAVSVDEDGSVSLWTEGRNYLSDDLGTVDKDREAFVKDEIYTDVRKNYEEVLKKCKNSLDQNVYDLYSEPVD